MSHPSNELSGLKLGSDQKDEDFYKELDKKSLHQSCCTCQTLAIFFVGLLLILSGTIFFLYWQISHGGGLRFNIAQMSTTKDFQSKLTNTKPDTTGVYRLALTSDELNTVINDGLSVSNFILKDMTLSIDPNEVLIYGNLIKPLNSKIVMTTVPKAENGKLFLDVTKISAGNVNLPAMFNKQATESLNSLLDKKMTTFYGKATVSTVSLEQNQIILIGNTK